MWTSKKAILNKNLIREIGRLLELYERYSHSEENPEVAEAYSGMAEEMGKLLIYADNHNKG
jgi:hypothetical protein